MSKSPLLNNIIVAINGSESSVKAAMYAIMMTRQYSLNLKFVYVVDTETIKFLSASKFLVAEESSAYEEDLNRSGKVYLDYVKDLAFSKGVSCETELRSGSVWAEVIKAADEYNADMILLGGHENKTGIPETSTLMRRSTYARSRTEIVTSAHCPVLVIHKPDLDKLFKIF